MEKRDLPEYERQWRLFCREELKHSLIMIGLGSYIGLMVLSFLVFIYLLLFQY